MAYQFQPPNIPGLQKRNIIPESIDALFNQYQQMKMAGLQEQALQNQNDASLSNFRLSNMGLSPQEVNQFVPQAMQPRATTLPPGMLPSNQQQSLYIPQEQPPVPMAPNPGQGLPGMGPGYSMPDNGLGQVSPVAEDPRLTTVRSILSMHQQGQMLGAAQQAAGLQKTQAEASKAGAEASLTGAQASLLSGSGGVVDHYVDQIKNGKMTADDLSNLGRGEVANAIKVAVGNKLAEQGVDINSLNNQQASAKKLSEAGAMPAAVTKSIMPSLDILDHLADIAGKDSWQTINKYGLKIAAEKGDRTANAIITQADVISEGAQNIYGSGSDSKLAVFQKALNAAKTKDQLKDSTKILKADFSNRIAALKSQPTDSSNPLDLNGKQMKIGRFMVQVH